MQTHQQYFVIVKVWLKDLEFPVALVKQVFTNKDNSKGVRYLNHFAMKTKLCNSAITAALKQLHEIKTASMAFGAA